MSCDSINYNGIGSKRPTVVAPVVRFQVIQDNPGRGYNRVMRQIAEVLPLPPLSRLIVPESSTCQIQPLSADQIRVYCRNGTPTLAKRSRGCQRQSLAED
jgi:hypothetical protein